MITAFKQHKIEFHNGYVKPIVTLDIKINDSKKLNGLDIDGKRALITELESFMERLHRFKIDVENSIDE